MSPDGTGVTELTHDPDPANLSIAWSPDGAKMALVSLRGPGFDHNIYVLDLASRAVTIVGQPGAYSGVSWQPVSNEVTDTPSASPQPATISSVGGIQVEVPPGWSVAQENLTPWLSHPTEVLSVGTFEMPVSHDPDDEPRVFDAPVAPAALAAMTATDAFVSLQASGPTDAPDDRPPSFRTAENRPCCSEQTGDYPFTWWWIPFIDQGRAFYLFVAVGNHAESSTSDQAWAIANSLVVDGTSSKRRRPPPPRDGLCKVPVPLGCRGTVDCVPGLLPRSAEGHRTTSDDAKPSDPSHRHTNRATEVRVRVRESFG